MPAAEHCSQRHPPCRTRPFDADYGEEYDKIQYGRLPVSNALPAPGGQELPADLEAGAATSVTKTAIPAQKVSLTAATSQTMSKR